MALPPQDATQVAAIAAQLARKRARQTPLLFSGTRTITAARALAKELRLGVYRVDLPAIVSKYIGETEKNIDRVFKAAGDGAVLLIDEADAMFGKRTEVKDAHDRYANLQSAYLLQRFESFGGLVVLATKRRQNLDAAFSRRLRMYEFPPKR